MRPRESERESTREGRGERTDEGRKSARTAWGRRRLLQVLSGAAGLTALGLPESEAIGVTRAQSGGSEQWSQQQKLTANDGDSDDVFGESVSVSNNGTTALIGAFEDEDPNGDKAGAAYVFTESGGRWSQQQKLSAADGDIDDGFGVSVSLSDGGTTALVGAADIDERNDDDETAPGSVYVFTQSSESWSQQQKLTATDGDTGDVFGRAVSVSDDGATALLGASGNESAYIFTESGGSWSQQQKLTVTDGGGILGVSASLSDDGTTALIGDSGSTYVFTESGESWSQQQKLTVADGSLSAFGESVSISNDGTTALVGALNDEDPNGSGAGSVYVFAESGGSWSQQQKLTANDGDSQDQFGRAVSVSNDGTTAFIGADSDEDPNGDRAGSVYVFTENGGSWSQQQKLSATNGDSTDFFGRSMSVSDNGTIALIGAPFDEAPTASLAGSGYVFTQSQPEMEAAVEQAGSPGEQAKVQYTLSNVSGQSRVTLDLAAVSQELTVNESASATSGTFESNGRKLVFSSPSGELTPTVAFDIAESANNSATFRVTADLRDETSAVTDSVETELGDTAGPGDLTGDGQAATDPDGDGTFEDVNGDGDTDTSDVTALFNAVTNQTLDSQTEQQLDINDDGSADTTDVTRLFIEATSN